MSPLATNSGGGGGDSSAPATTSAGTSPPPSTDCVELVKALNQIHIDLTTTVEKKAQQLALKEVEQFFNSVNDDLKSLTSRAGTILSILISVITAILAVVTLQLRPPYWVPLVPAVPLLLAVFTSSWLFVGSKVVASPTIERLAGLSWMNESDAADALIELYKKMLLGGKGEFYVLNRAIPRGDPPAGPPADPNDDPKFDGILRVLRTKQRLFDWSVVLLGITLGLVVTVSLAVYWP
jgi:hypothetical protein